MLQYTISVSLAKLNFPMRVFLQFTVNICHNFLDCKKVCVKGTLNAKCDACKCEDHVLTGRVLTKNNAPLSEAEISLAETPYNVLAQTNATGFFTAFNVCADANQELFIARKGFVPLKIKATLLTSKTANVKATLKNAGTYQ